MNQTKFGILFIFIGLIILIIPIINLLIPILFLLAIFSFIRGRNEFDNHHQLNVIFASAFSIVFIFVFLLGTLLISLFNNQYLDESISILSNTILIIAMILFIKIFVKRIILVSFLLPIFASVIFAIYIPYAFLLAIIFLFTIYFLALKEINKYQVYVDDQRIIRHAKVEQAEKVEIQKVYEYYCPACLFQTNDEFEKCPKCNEKGLARTA